MRLEFRMALCGAALLVLFGLVGRSRAQTAVVPYPVNPPVVLAGPDVGFRITDVKGDVPVGQLVVRVKGEWKVVEFGSSRLPLGQ